MSTPATNNGPPLHRWGTAAATSLLFLMLLALLVGLNMRRELNHDEHQFIASAALFARDGLRPYQDFAYFHVPAQSYLYALLFRIFDSLLLTSRLVNIVFGWLSLILLFGLARHRRQTCDPESATPWAAWRFAALAALWMAALPLFSYTSGRAWNHDLPIFLLMAATILHMWAITGRHRSAWYLLTGVMLGLAAATRLSFGVIGLPFVLIIWLAPGQSVRKRLLDTVMLGMGGLIGGLPLLMDLLRSPESFLFGNLTYVRLNTLFYRSQGGTGAISLPDKLAYLGRQFTLAPTSLLTLLAALVGLWPLGRWLFLPNPSRSRELNAARLRIGFLLLLSLFSAISALAATPPQPQYFYPLFPVALMLIVELYVIWPAALRPGGYYVYALAGLTTVLLAVSTYAPGTAILFQPGEWFPVKTRSYGRLIADLTAGDASTSGRVLTLAPLYALEGAVPIYPEFATGPFAWRVSPLMGEAERNRFHIVSPDDLAALLAAHSPRAILTNVENDDADEEASLVDYAEENGFLPVTLPDESILWLAPQARWGDAIQLGGRLLPAEPVAPGDQFLTVLYLQSLAPMEINYNRLIRIVDSEGSELLRADGWPFGSPTSHWATGDVWADGQEFSVPADAARGYYRIDASFYDPATLDEIGAPVSVGYLFVDGAGSPVMEQDPALDVAFGEEIVLQQARAELLPSGTTDSGMVAVDLLWQPQQAIADEYKRFVHILDTEGTLIAQSDGVPADGFLPTTAWRPETAIVDHVEVPLPDVRIPGPYTVIVGLYEQETLERLPARWADASGDAYTVGQVK